MLHSRSHLLLPTQGKRFINSPHLRHRQFCVLYGTPSTYKRVFLTFQKKQKTPQLPPDPIFPADYCTISSLPLVARRVASNYSPLILSYTSSVEIVSHYYTKLVLCQVHWLLQMNPQLRSVLILLTHQQQFRTNLSILHDRLSSLGFQDTI